MSTETVYKAQVSSITPALAEIERALDWITDLASWDRSGKPRVVPTIQTRGKRHKLCAWFASNRWTDGSADHHEIGISAEALRSPVIEIIGHVIHEAVHLHCEDEGIKDCAKSGRHNKRFKAEAEKVGLIVEQQSNGWGFTKPSQSLEKLIETELMPKAGVFEHARKALEPGESRQTVRSWTCGCTNVQVATKVELDAECNACGEHFEPKA